jgi:hypothetical protein
VDLDVLLAAGVAGDEWVGKAKLDLALTIDLVRCVRFTQLMDGPARIESR